MDGQRFDDLTRLLGISLHRKRFTALVAGLVGSAAAAGLGEAAAAKRRGTKRRRRRNDGVGAQGGELFCTALCDSEFVDLFCDTSSLCGNDSECPAERPVCCQSGACGTTGEGSCCSAPICGGFCTKDADCPPVADCVCDNSDNRCVTVTCGGVCTKDADCQDSPGCVCELPVNGLVGDEGIGPVGQCVTATCGGACTEGADCESGGLECICDESAGECVTITCAGFCFKDADCPDLENCSCTINIPPALVGTEGVLIPGTCVSQACPGECSSNFDCTEQGQENCVCFLGDDVNVAAVVAEGPAPVGSCGACLGAGASCDASTECCGQLVCQGSRCQRKRTPRKKKERCARHGKSCTQDPGCCAQAICYRGECGEKDTHCTSDKECARGYSCVGGRLTGGHRRCRRNRRKPPRNRRNRG